MKKFYHYALRITHYALSIALCALLFAGCGGTAYKHLTHDEAIKMVRENPDAVILDVRAQDEYEKKHVTGAILIPIDDLRNGDFSKLPDKNATILIYCWTGRRAEDSAQILVDNGYKNIYEFGGIADWKGPVEGTEAYGYKTISQEEAVEMLANDPKAVLIDCRFQKDYDARHIVGAVHFPLEAAVGEKFDKIPDKDAPLITYCGDGNRGRLTAKVLVENGYSNVYTMGGIIDWKGEVEGTEVENSNAQ